MDKPIQFALTNNQAARLEEAIDDLIVEMKRAAKRMKRDQAKIEQLKAETRVMLKQLKAA